MAEQKSLSDEELRDAFEKAKGERRATFEEDGTSGILRQLSGTVAKLQAVGVDIGIEVFAGDHAAAYDMMYTARNFGSSTGSINAYGLIRIGGTQYLFAVANQIGEREVSEVYLSKFNTGLATFRSTPDKGQTKSHASIPADIFDFKADSAALQKLQQRLLFIAAQQAVMIENDPANVFNAPAEPYTKPQAKLKR